ncbi:TPA: hypothetical protein KML26_004199 [Escherichia coli]|nr:hypothetical protein [Escherichia coli]
MRLVDSTLQQEYNAYQRGNFSFIFNSFASKKPKQLGKRKYRKINYLSRRFPTSRFPGRFSKKIESFKIQKLFSWEAGSDTKNTQKLLKTKKKMLPGNSGKRGKPKNTKNH